jgi:glycosyltransferase involved in cell wall biosynthesis
LDWEYPDVPLMKTSGDTTPVPELVSIIIPTFNRSATVLRAIQSVVGQDYPHKQIIVVDDGSTDDTEKRVAAVQDVEYVRQENRGPAAASNAGLRLARGEFIATLDSDDVWHPDFLSSSVEALHSTGVEFVFSNRRICNVEGVHGDTRDLTKLECLKRFQSQPKGRWFILTPEETRQLFMKTFPAPSSSSLFRQHVVRDGWNEKARSAYDLVLRLHAILVEGAAAAYTLETLWDKWVDGTNLFDSNPNRIQVAANEANDWTVILESFGSRMTPEEIRLLKSRLARSYRDWGYHEAGRGNTREACRRYCEALRFEPSLSGIVETGKALVRSLRGSSRQLDHTK